MLPALLVSLAALVVGVVGAATNTTTASMDATSSSSSSASACNGYDAFCSRSYADMTFLGAHNSYAVGSATADNQNYDVTYQLKDGVRLLQGQVHNKTNSDGDVVLELCHTDCALQDGGSLLADLKKVKAFVDANPREVVTMLWVNYDNLPIPYFASVYKAAGVDAVSYAPSGKVTTWPTLGSLISAGTPVVNFITSQTDTTNFPYLMNEWDYTWETPFEVTDYRNFTCGLDRGTRPNALYLANHFAYHQTTVLKYSFDSPDTDNIDKTNSMASVNAHLNLCYSLNNKFPNFVLVDQYDAATGGALQSVAAANGVTYTQTQFGDRSANSLVTRIKKFFGGQHMARNIGLVAGGGVLLLIVIWACCCCWCIRGKRRAARKDRQSLDLFVGATPFRPTYSAPRPSPPLAEKAALATSTTTPLASSPSTSPSKHPLLVTRPSPSVSPERRVGDPAMQASGSTGFYEPRTARTDLRLNQSSPYALATQAHGGARSVGNVRGPPPRPAFGEGGRPTTAGNARSRPAGARVDPFGGDESDAYGRHGPRPFADRPRPQANDGAGYGRELRMQGQGPRSYGGPRPPHGQPQNYGRPLPQPQPHPDRYYNQQQQQQYNAY